MVPGGVVFDFNRGYNGQCKCAIDGCQETRRQQGYNIYRVAPGAPAVGADISVDLATLAGLVPAGGDSHVEVYDIWQQRVVGTVPLPLTAGSNASIWTATNVAYHGTAFLRLAGRN